MAAIIRSTVNSLNPITGASRDDLQRGDVVGLTSVNTATTYSWSIAYKPEGSAATFSGSDVAQSPGTFTVDVEGPYLIRLITDLGLVTESEQFVRLRYLTDFGSLKLVAAGEQIGEGIPVPVDATATGWADEQNFNLGTLTSLLGQISTSNQVVHVDQTAGYGSYQVIQDAIDYAATLASSTSPWIVFVHPGTYTENLSLQPFVYLVGYPGSLGLMSNTRTVLIRGTHTTNNTGASDNCLLANLTFEQLNASTTPVITHDSEGTLHIYRCRVAQNGVSPTQGYAILQGQGSLVIDESQITHTTSGNATRYAFCVNPSTASNTQINRSVLSGPSVCLLNPGFYTDCVVSILDTQMDSTHASGKGIVSDASSLTVSYSTLSTASGDAILVHPGAAVFNTDVEVYLRWSFIEGDVSYDVTGIAGSTVLDLGASAYSTLTLPGGDPAAFDSSVKSASIYYDNTISGLSSIEVQAAIDELAAMLATFPTTLDGAYDGGTPGSGSGRTIIADAGPVTIYDSALPSNPPPVGETNGGLQAVGPINVGAISYPEISLEPNPFGTGPTLKMGWTVVPSNSYTGVGVSTILARSTGSPFYRNYDLRIGTESSTGGGKIGDVVIAAGDGYASGVTTPDPGNLYMYAGSGWDGTAGAGSVYINPGEGTTGNGSVIFAKPDTGTGASVTAAGVFVGGVTGDVTFATPMGSVTASILNTDNHATVLGKLNALNGITAAGNPITVTSVMKGPGSFVYLLSTDPGGLDTALGVFQGQVMVPGTWTETISVDVTLDQEITIGANGATGPLIYNADTGKLTVPGLIDPTGMVFTRAGIPTTGATEGAIFVSDGTGGLTAGHFYYRPASNGTPVDISGGGTGDVVGPGSSTANALVRFSGTSGKLVKNSTATLDDAGALSTTSVSVTDATVTGTLNATGATITGIDASDVGADPAGTSATGIAAHVAAANPHTQYLKSADAATSFSTASLTVSTTLNATGATITGIDAGDVGADPAGTGATQAASAVAAHVAAANPHTQYLQTSVAASTYQPLNSNLTTIGGLAPLVPSVLTYSGSSWAATAETFFLRSNFFGLGVDGNLAFDGVSNVTIKGSTIVPSAGVYTMTSDVDAQDVTISNGVRIDMRGFMFRAWSITLSGNSATAYISDNGNPASAPGAGSAISNACTTGRTSAAGGAGVSIVGSGSAGGNLTSPATGGAGGAGGTSGGSGGTVAWTKTSVGELSSLNSMITGRGYGGTSWKGGAGGGGGGIAVGGSGNSGGGGGGGGVLYVCVVSITVSGTGSTLYIEANGGTGGSATGTSVNAGGGGGGGGGSVIFFYRMSTLGSGSAITARASGGAAGAGAGGGASGSNGSAGNVISVTL